MVHAMNEDNSNPELMEAGRPGDPPETGAEATPQGGRGSALSDPSDSISIEAQRVFAQRGPIPEAELSEAWGIPRQMLREARQATLEDDDWEQVDRAIVIHPDGCVKLAATFDVTDFSHFEKKGGPEDADEAEAAPCFVVSVPRNPKMVLVAEKKGGPATGRLRVRSSRNFVPGMDLTGRVRLIDGHADFYELVGNQPRFRGRF